MPTNNSHKSDFRTIFNTAAASLLVILIVAMVGLYNNVQANTEHRMDAQSKEKVQQDMLIKLELVIQELKFLRKDVDELKDSQKNLSDKLETSRERIIGDYQYQPTSN